MLYTLANSRKEQLQIASLSKIIKRRNKCKWRCRQNLSRVQVLIPFGKVFLSIEGKYHYYLIKQAVKYKLTTLFTSSGLCCFLHFVQVPELEDEEKMEFFVQARYAYKAGLSGNQISDYQNIY